MAAHCFGGTKENKYREKTDHTVRGGHCVEPSTPRAPESGKSVGWHQLAGVEGLIIGVSDFRAEAGRRWVCAKQLSFLVATSISTVSVKIKSTRPQAGGAARQQCTTQHVLGPSSIPRKAPLAAGFQPVVSHSSNLQ